MSIWRFAERFSETPVPARVTLGEGDTPLVRSRRIGPAIGLEQLYFKLESTNPTGSYKDRFAAAAVSDMLAHDARACLATSSGNAGAALAAYCAAAGMPCCVAVVDSAPRNKLRQMMVYGARIFSIRGFGLDAAVTDRVLQRLATLAIERHAALQISAYRYSPAGMAGVETLAFELAEQLPERLDHVFCPAGGGGMTLAVARGFQRLRSHANDARRVAVECVQPEGNNTIAGPLAHGKARACPTTSTTKVSGLQVANVIDGDETLAACRVSGGTGHLVSDEQVFAAQARLAREEGIFCEPAAAVALAGAIAARASGYLRPGAVVVCCVTGIGFKDEPAAERIVAGAECPMLEQVDQIDSHVPSD
jgi:threonine synthase